jgi:hypothetical protein
MFFSGNRGQEGLRSTGPSKVYGSCKTGSKIRKNEVYGKSKPQVG